MFSDKLKKTSANWLPIKDLLLTRLITCVDKKEYQNIKLEVELSRYRFEIVYGTGQLNSKANALIRVVVMNISMSGTEML